MKKRKILIVENYAHLWQVQGVSDVFSVNFQCDVLIPKKLNETYKLKNNIILSKFNFLTLLKAFILAKNYDYIYLNSSPEYPDYPKNFKSLLVYIEQMLSLILLSIFYKEKLIIYFRGIYRILPEMHRDKKIFYWIRKKIFLISKRFVFENKNLENKFNQEVIVKSKKNFLTTTLYTRFNYSNIIENKNLENNSKMTIGILGAIDPLRKNYKILEGFANKNKIKIIFLGKFLKDLSESVIRRFNGCEVIYKNFLEDEEFKELGNMCHLLVSLNKENKFYGDYKGTGSFGDALLLKKPLLAPSFSDKIKEFKDFTIYYNQEKDLELLLEKFKEEKKFANINFDQFLIDNCRKKIISDLELNIN